jgi:hypothetical protein
MARLSIIASNSLYEVDPKSSRVSEESTTIVLMVLCSIRLEAKAFTCPVGSSSRLLLRAAITARCKS